MKREMRFITAIILMAIGLGGAPRASAAEIHETKKAAGSYVWVPDSLIDEVQGVLSGPDTPADKVTFRGDTIPVVLRSRNFSRFDRGLTNFLFIPKGQWAIGVTASYAEFNTKDLEVLDLLSDIDLGGHMFSVNPYISYFIRNNMSIGLKLGYSASKGYIDHFNVDIDEDMSFNLHDIMYRSETYSGGIAYRNYFGITRGGRFGVFNEVDLLFSKGSNDFTRPYDGELKNTHTGIFQAELNFLPGVSAFVIQNISFNISFGVFGFKFRNEKQTIDHVPAGNRFTSGANFRFNIFNINFGLEAVF